MADLPNAVVAVGSAGSYVLAQSCVPDPKREIGLPVAESGARL